MGLITGLLNVISKRNSTCKSLALNFIFYRIVNFHDKTNKYLLQCINTKATFLMSMRDIVQDTDILYGLHPVQACYVGIEYGIQTKTALIPLSISDHTIKPAPHFRYGTFCLQYQTREKNLCFINEETNQSYIMDPRDIALSEQIINEFDSVQAFYVGILAGLKMASPVGIRQPKYKRPHLTLIKNND